MDNPYDIFEVRAEETARQKSLAKLESEAATEIAEAWHWLLDNPQGRRLVWFMLNRCGVFNISFTGRAATTDFNEGQRNIGCWMMNTILATHPGAWVQMLKEQDDEREQRRRSSPGSARAR